MKENRIVNDINGMIILNKPKDMTSNDCLSIIKKNIHPKKIGHTGTLDKNATGVLVCLLGNATKSQDYLMRSCNKVYEAELLLGIKTDTEDMLGEVIEKDLDSINNLNFDDVKKTVESFIGNYVQIPPMYSSKKVNGQKLLNLARKGIEVERKAENLIINDIKVNSIIDYKLHNFDLKCINIVVDCSKGTYIRTLCKDIGEKLGVPACMGNLCRIKSGEFTIEDSVKLDVIKDNVLNNDYSFIKPCYYNEKPTTLTFGKFETLHIGHLMIIKDIVKYAKENDLLSTVMIVGDNIDNDILTRDQRISKLKYLGIDKIINFPLDSINKNISAEYFVKEILSKQLKTKYIAVGDDCRFGKMASGDKELLLKLCDELDIELKVIDKLKVENTDMDISSTLIKSEYSKNNFDLVNKLIGKG